jgi:hypothetical protein
MQVEEKALKLVGWKSKKTTYLEFYRCPGCGHTQETIFWGAHKKAECFSCHEKFPKDAFALTKVRRVVAECRECGADVPFTPNNYGFAGLGYICSECGNYVAVSYGMRTIDPSEALKPAWNPTMRERGERVDGTLVFTNCRSKKDYLIVKLLQAMAKEEESSFMFVRDDEHSVGILLDAMTGKYLGFVAWNVSGQHAVLRQIFIVPDERRKGLASRMVTFWVEHYADKVSEKFGIESPNEKAVSLHTTLGHVRIEGDSVIGVKCFRVVGL